MLRAIKYELNPTSVQKTLIKQTCGCCRKVYNILLDRKIKAYKEDSKTLSCAELMRELTKLKEQFPYLKEVSSVALQQAVNNLDTAYKSFFRKKGSGFPKFKKKGIKDSYRIVQPGNIDFTNWTAHIAKIGKVRIFKGRNKEINGKIKSFTTTHTSTDRYFISVLYETSDKPKLMNNKAVGIDVGVKDFAVLSDGKVFESQEYLKHNLRKLRILQRTASRRYKKGLKREEQSNNWKKAIFRINKLHERISFQRNDFLHKLSNLVASNYSVVCVETLGVKSMMKNHHLARSIADVSWAKFIELLEYKCDKLIKVDRWFASSQTCYDCCYVNKATKNLRVRKWTCPNCGAHHDRDLNAAKNILREGLSLCGLKVDGCIKLATEPHLL